ncbi:peptidase family M49-domain-containing protein [Xylaria bambusicola]|uniref:peptidase family M49-domain-containing protein n=1 Tax=Xylaria bambusicola TaxID=326684 RepID=UPI0020077A98|nr:peptidase family M49-domain-containing protein [Xylaria bambusicola]KAI0509555.1 peptidase family M49-domain-containing protein [Xylaria bambusicola]
MGSSPQSISNHRPSQSLTVRVDRAKIKTHGKPALGKMLLRLHMYRSTADVDGCRAYYEALSKVHETHVEWRQTVKGLLQSWAERAV